ncbi:MAG: hypothetical protein M3A24_05415 [Candidatus Rhabdochlamydia oedothoracis]|nr:hypothetical protein [Candidatus Rhabdochlamydia oedothoracis]
MINDEKLMECHFHGFIPGPQEEVFLFLKRTELAKCQKTFYQALDFVQSLFDVYPSWVRIELTDRLYLWEAAATYIEENQGIFTPVVQIKKKGVPFWCAQEEILAHELVHATRIAFKENLFEEVLAYKTSRNWLRRYFGPIFFHPKEVVLFLFLLVGIWCYQLSCLFFFDDLPSLTLWIPLILTGLLIIRVIIVQTIFSLCLKKIRRLLKQPDKALGFALRLSDKEIIAFAFKSLDKMRKYIGKIQEKNLRWHMLALIYMP